MIVWHFLIILNIRADEEDRRRRRHHPPMTPVGAVVGTESIGHPKNNGKEGTAGDGAGVTPNFRCNSGENRG